LFSHHSIIGGILLVGGLYSVLWGKSKETKIAPCIIEMNDMDECHKSQENEETTSSASATEGPKTATRGEG
jgi:hypothetical protein